MESIGITSTPAACAAAIQAFVDMPVIAPEDIPVLDIPKPEERTAEEPERDQATLSTESKSYCCSPEALQEKFKAELEFLNQLLLLLQNFNSSNSNSIMDELDKLLALYNNFLNNLIGCADKEQSAALRHQCQNHLTVALTKLIRTHLPELDSFFQSYGSPAVRENIKSAFFSFVTGERNIPELDHNIRPFKTGVLYQKPAHASTRSGAPSSASQQTHTAPKQITQFEAPVSALKTPRSFEQKQNFHLDIPHSDKKTAQRVIQNLNNTEQFVKYVKQAETQGTLSDIRTANDELLGVVKADLTIKTQIFSENAKLPPSASSALRSAVDRFIDYHLPSTSKRTYRAYTATMKQYQSSGSPKAAFDYGLKYAVEQMDVGADRNLNIKKENAPLIQEMMPEFIRLLKEDWKHFLAALPYDYDSTFKKVFSHHSLWAASLDTDATDTKRLLIPPAALKLIWAAAIFCIVCLLILF